MSSDDDVELTVRGDNASSGDDDTIELSPQSTGDCERFSCWIHKATSHCD